MSRTTYRSARSQQMTIQVLRFQVMPLKGVAVTNLERICEKASRKTAVVISGAGLSSSKFLAHVVPNPHMIEASIWMHAILSQPDERL